MPCQHYDVSAGALGPLFFLDWTLVQPISHICIGLKPLLVLHCAAHHSVCIELGPFFLAQ
jgi:hypothetical protein